MESSRHINLIRFVSNRLRERLWVRPLVMCFLSILAVTLANSLDGTSLAQHSPAITPEAVEALLTIMTASMLVIATFAVGAMVSAYASASRAATPRAFALVIADDVSQNALSAFLGAFIFSTVALVALKSNYLEATGCFVVFVVACLAFAAVIFLFVRWVDRIARLGRLGATIEKVERATAAALTRRKVSPTLYGVPSGPNELVGQAVHAEQVGYVQHIDVAALQAWAEKAQTRLTVMCLPGAFVTPDQALAYVSSSSAEQVAPDLDQVARKFTIGDQRVFEDDPRFGLIVMSQIAARALSPAVNDPGTAIDVIGSLVRLLVLWTNEPEATNDSKPKYDRVAVPTTEVRDLFDDAFTAISRDGAGMVEVSVRLHQALHSLAAVGDAAMRDAAKNQSRIALARAEMTLKLPEDLEAVRAAAGMTSNEDTNAGARHSKA